jgi:uracil-DNA glycosylase family 4
MRERVPDLYIDQGIVPSPDSFSCEFLRTCSNSTKIPLCNGNWPYIGSDYGKGMIGGVAYKILFIAMDRGGEGFSDKETFMETQSEFYEGTVNPGNPHMGGVSLILQRLLDAAPISVLAKCYSLTNALKCTKKTGSMSTNPTRKMITNCAVHLKAEIGTLDPNLIVTQGAHPSDTVLELFPESKTIDSFSAGSRSTTAVYQSEKTIILVTPHPARQPGLCWKQGVLPPFFERAIDLAKESLGNVT